MIDGKKVKPDRSAFWIFCRRSAAGAQARAKKKNLPCSIDDHWVDRQLVKQNWRCCVSGIELRPPGHYKGESRCDPFGPSLDRAVPSLGYAPGNVRIVCTMVNMAINEWGLDAFLEVFVAMKRYGAALADQSKRAAGEQQ